MPFKSEKQRKWMWANEPEMAEEWEDEEDNKREGKIMKITQRQLRRIIREAVIADSVWLEIMQDKRGPMDVTIPYYIIEDALEDGLGVDGLFLEIEEFINNEYSPADAFTFSPAADREIREMHKQYQEGGVWSDERDYEAGFYR